MAAHLEAQLSDDVMATLQRAAEIEGRTVSDFVVSAAHAAAQRTIEGVEVIHLAPDDQRRLADAVLEPPTPTPALIAATRRHRELFGKE